jgi:hypothetical protein
MSDTTQQQQQSGAREVPVERTNAYRAGFMNGYTADNPTSDPSIAGYMDGYFVQQDGVKPDASE